MFFLLAVRCQLTRRRGVNITTIDVRKNPQHLICFWDLGFLDMFLTAWPTVRCSVGLIASSVGATQPGHQQHQETIVEQRDPP